MFKLIPKEVKFFDLFEKQVQVLKDCLPLLLEIETGRQMDVLWEKIIREIEQNCDAVTKEIIIKAGQTFITPIDREDIYTLAKAVDDITDYLEEIVVKIVDYNVLPDMDLKKFIQTLRLSVTRVCEGIFKLRKSDNIDGLQIKMKECEHTADALIKEIIADSYEIQIENIFKDEKFEAIGIRELQKIFDSYNLKRKKREIAETMENAVDACERVFHILGNIYLKQC